MVIQDYEYAIWEDDGTKSENELSMFSPNHKTIKQYREDFLKNKRGELK